MKIKIESTTVYFALTVTNYTNTKTNKTKFITHKTTLIINLFTFNNFRDLIV